MCVERVQIEISADMVPLQITELIKRLGELWPEIDFKWKGSCTLVGTALPRVRREMRFDAKDKRDASLFLLVVEFPQMTFTPRDVAGLTFYIDFDADNVRYGLIKSKYGNC